MTLGRRPGKGSFGCRPTECSRLRKSHLLPNGGGGEAEGQVGMNPAVVRAYTCRTHVWVRLGQQVFRAGDKGSPHLSRPTVWPGLQGWCPRLSTLILTTSPRGPSPTDEQANRGTRESSKLLPQQVRAQLRSGLSRMSPKPWLGVVRLEPSSGLAHGVRRGGSSPWGARTLGSASAQADERICPLGDGCVPGTSPDLPRERGVTGEHTGSRITAACLNPDLTLWRLCDFEQVS